MSDQANQQGEWLTVRQYAEKYKISIGTIRDRIYRKSKYPMVTAKKIHGMWRIWDDNQNMYINGPTGDYSDLAILRAAEVAVILRCPQRRVSDLAQHGLLKYKTILGIRHFPLSEILRLIDIKEKHDQWREKNTHRKTNTRRLTLIAWALREIKERRPNSDLAKPL